MPPVSGATLLTASDLQNIFSDALTSFSPLATLVGADSARAFAQDVTNVKQAVLSNIAPIGALGMMSTVCKASELPGIKDMLGAGDADVFDAASDTGTYTLYGRVPRLSKSGTLSTTRETNRGVSACAIIKVPWTTGNADQVDFDRIGRVSRDFVGATVSGRLVWECRDSDEFREKTQYIVSAIWNLYDNGQGIHHPYNSDHMMIYKHLSVMSAGKGVFELHWPSPALPLETRSWVPYVAIFAFTVSSALFAALTASPLLAWQSPIASAFLLGGQIVLCFGQCCVHITLWHLRKKKVLTIPTLDSVKEWTLVDNTWFVSCLARRPLQSRILSTSSSDIELSQYVTFGNNHIPSVQAILTLFTIVAGFLIFYIGAKASNWKTVLIFIFIFLVANSAKASLIKYANACHFTPLNNFGYGDIVNREEVNCTTRAESLKVAENIEGDATEFAENADNKTASALPRDSVIPSIGLESPVGMTPTPSTESALICHRELPFYEASLRSATSGQAHENEPATSKPQTPLQPLSQYRVYAKLAVRHQAAIGIFYYARPQEWAIAAHIIFDVVRRELPGYWGEPNEREKLCHIPLEFWLPHHESPHSHIVAALVLALDETRFEDVFWSAGQEITSILMDNFVHPIELPSESRRVTDLSILSGFVYIITRMLLTSVSRHGNGARSIMRAIDLVRMKYPYDDSVWIVNGLKQAALKAAVDCIPR